MISRLAPLSAAIRLAAAKRLSTPQLAQRIASMYDNKESHGVEYAELVSRVGTEEAERLFNQA